MTSTKSNGRQSDLRELDSLATAGNDELARAHAILYAIGQRRVVGNTDNNCAGGVWGTDIPEGDVQETAGNGRE